jgi:flagellar basal body-associated protein FliL
MNPLQSASFRLARIPFTRGASRVVPIALVAVIVLAAGALFFEWRSARKSEHKAEKASIGKIHSKPKEKSDKTKKGDKTDKAGKSGKKSKTTVEEKN